MGKRLSGWCPHLPRHMLCHRPLINRSDTRERLVIPYDHVLGYATYRKVLFDTDMLIFINIRSTLNSHHKSPNNQTTNRQFVITACSFEFSINNNIVTVSIVLPRSLSISAGISSGFNFNKSNAVISLCVIFTFHSLLATCHIRHSSWIKYLLLSSRLLTTLFPKQNLLIS